MNMVLSLICVVVFGGSAIGQACKTSKPERQQDYQADQNDSLLINSQEKDFLHAVNSVNGDSNSVKVQNAAAEPLSCDNSQTTHINKVEVIGENNEVNIIQSGGNAATTIRQRGNSNQISITQKTR